MINALYPENHVALYPSAIVFVMLTDDANERGTVQIENELLARLGVTHEQISSVTTFEGFDVWGTDQHNHDWCIETLRFLPGVTAENWHAKATETP